MQSMSSTSLDSETIDCYLHFSGNLTIFHSVANTDTLFSLPRVNDLVSIVPRSKRTEDRVLTGKQSRTKI